MSAIYSVSGHDCYPTPTANYGYRAHPGAVRLVPTRIQEPPGHSRDSVDKHRTSLELYINDKSTAIFYYWNISFFSFSVSTVKRVELLII
jgi:hypothetical protein